MWGGYSSGSEDSFVCETRDAVPGLPKVEENTVLIPIKIRDCGSKYSRTLFDVEGNPLVNTAGNPLHVYTKLMQDEFDSGRLRLIHCMKEPTFAYFVTSDYQKDVFQRHRKVGALPYRKSYYVYVDDDIDKTSYEYKTRFVPFTPRPKTATAPAKKT